MTRPHTFYVYAHTRSTDGAAFYVGKGSWTPKKAYGRSASSENRNAIWRRTVKKHGGFCAVVLAEFFAESDAFAFEAALIAEYGRRDRGGNLCNLTDGGEGAVGRVVKEESLRKRAATMASRPRRHGPGPMTGKRHNEAAKKAIQQAALGSNNPMSGRSHSTESRAKMSAAVRANHARSRRVLDEATGHAYPSAREAARTLNMNPNTLKAWLSGRYTNRSTLRYE